MSLAKRRRQGPVREGDRGGAARRARRRRRAQRQGPARRRAARELALAAFPERADPRDALVARARGATLTTLPRGARVGTGSVRRARAAAAGCARISRSCRCAATCRRGSQARARGARRGGARVRGARPARPRRARSPSGSTRALLPAVAQGALAVQARRGDPLAARARARSTHRRDRRRASPPSARVRRGSARDCNVPLGAHAPSSTRGRLALRVRLLDRAGRLARSSARPRAMRATPRRVGARARREQRARRAAARRSSRRCARRARREARARDPGRRRARARRI